uniref:very short patch repair endonuclease n=2 Tax=Bacteroidales TaxID=171549 RepID=UPI0026EA6328
KTVVFIDGCFWHGHEGCKYYRLPNTNVDFWRHKIAMNIARDYANGVDLRLAGWKVIRVWECDIKTKAKREEILERLYHEIVGDEHKSSTYVSTPNGASIAAEPNTSYGDKKI